MAPEARGRGSWETGSRKKEDVGSCNGKIRVPKKFPVTYLFPQPLLPFTNPSYYEHIIELIY